MIRWTPLVSLLLLLGCVADPIDLRAALRPPGDLALSSLASARVALKLGICTVREGEQWANGEDAGRGNLHPRGWGTDLDVLPKRGGGYHGWMNWPDPSPRRLGTQIAYLESDDAQHWSAPRVTLRKAQLGALANGGVETPSVILNDGVRPDFGRWILGVLAKKVVDGNRTDSIALLSGPTVEGPWLDSGIVMRPEHPWEAPYLSSRYPGKTTGGDQEPTFVFMGRVLVCYFVGDHYGRGEVPMIGVAALLPGEREWRKWPKPLFAGGQAEAELVPGGIWLYYGAPPPQNQRIERRFSRDGINFGDPEVVLRVGNRQAFDGGQVLGPAVVSDRIWWFGRPWEQRNPVRFGVASW